VVLILTAVDILGSGPTFRKAFLHPFNEQLTLFVLMATVMAIVFVFFIATVIHRWRAAV